MAETYDAIVVGSGPNGLAAAITLARAGLQVLVVEALDTPGGSCRTAELTLPGFHHDICAAIHPMGVASPFFTSVDLFQHGLQWRYSPTALSHPLPDGRVAQLKQSLKETCECLANDGPGWQALLQPFVDRHQDLLDDLLRPLRIPKHPVLMAKFGLKALRSATKIATSHFHDQAAKALFGGCAAHSFLPLSKSSSASFGLVLALTGHAGGWPCAAGGSQRIVEAMARCFEKLGGRLQFSTRVQNLRELPPVRAILMDLTPRQVANIAGDKLTPAYRRQLQRFRYGPGVFKLDLALSRPIPWRNPECLQSATVHVGGTFEEIGRAEASACSGQIPERPFVLVAQQSLFDTGRAPEGKQTVWAYCHVPHGCPEDMTERIEARIDEFAPGFRDTIIRRHKMTPANFETHNPNLVGGDISGGANDLLQFLFRPVPRWDPYSTPNPRLFICSSSTPPGGGVHGMCGYWAANSALRKVFGRKAFTLY